MNVEIRKMLRLGIIIFWKRCFVLIFCEVCIELRVMLKIDVNVIMDMRGCLMVIVVCF